MQVQAPRLCVSISSLMTWCSTLLHQRVASPAFTLNDRCARSAEVSCVRRFTPQDEQLYRDVEGLIELLCNTLSALTKHQKQQGHSLPEQPAYLAALLQLFDAACWFLKGRSKPANWVSCLFKVAKLFSTESRTSAAASCQVGCWAAMTDADLL